MRRKKVHGVHTNKTVKRCFCKLEYCRCCRSVCKVSFNSRIDEKNVSDNHLIESRSNKRKLHKIGVGSLLPGRKFVFFDPKDHFYDDYNYGKPITKRFKRMRSYKELDNQLEEYFTLEEMHYQYIHKAKNRMNK